VIRVIDTINRDGQPASVTVVGHWRSREGVPYDADEVA
jgi:hypothetical protein